MLGNLIAAQHELEHSLKKYKQACNAIPYDLKPPFGYNFSDLEAASNAHERFVESLGETTNHGGIILKKTRNQYIPVNRLHPELLASIIQLDASRYSCAAKYRFLNEAQKGITRLISLSGVCSHWRRLIVGFGLLWSRVPLGTTPASYKIVQLCLERAQNSRLDILAYTSRADDGWMGHDMLLSLSQRIGSLSVDAQTPDQIHSAMNHMIRDAHDPLCGPKELSLKYGGVANRLLIPSDLSLQQGLNNLFGRLDRLHLSGVDLDWSQCDFNQLQTLSIDSAFSSRQLGCIATACPNLRILELSPSQLEGMDLEPSEQSQNPSPSLFRRLQILRVACHQFNILQRVLQSILTGAYEVEIFLHVELAIELGYMRPLTSAVCRFDDVTKLGILGQFTWPRYKDENISSISKMFPNVHTLYWGGPHFDERILNFLYNPECGGPVLPKLSTLKLLDGLIPSSVTDQFIAMALNYPIRHIQLITFWTETQLHGAQRLVEMDTWSPQFLLLSRALPSISICRSDPCSTWW
ncbi:hypothetical protein RSOL_414720 [Rhizoctonia solani AG-3 Rhs1AP]|uniref:F-box-like domain protein n=1 Tax=Rhizoctonia solani AG-3 Rhs1AP TaxID=1086054 RepID=X8JF28_9AGAM|nr:hypothetical protein RSOL_414720 [Rhizoctonia solani AG-3 Rhs1AP]